MTLGIKSTNIKNKSRLYPYYIEYCSITCYILSVENYIWGLVECRPIRSRPEQAVVSISDEDKTLLIHARLKHCVRTLSQYARGKMRMEMRYSFQVNRMLGFSQA